MDLFSASDRLYSGPPEQFVALRKDLARQARSQKDGALARQIEALRRPSRSAWLVNLLARHAHEPLEELLALAPALAEIHLNGSPQQLRELATVRRAAVNGLLREAVRLGRERGYPPSDAVRLEVETTLEAALGHPAAAGQLLGGALVSAPESAASFPLELFGPGGLPASALHANAGLTSDEADCEASASQAPAAGGDSHPAPAEADELAPVVSFQAAKQHRAERERQAARRKLLDEAEAALRQAREQERRARREAEEREQALQAAQQGSDTARGAVEALGQELEAVETRRRELEAELADLVERQEGLMASQARLGAEQESAAQRLGVEESLAAEARETVGEAGRAVAELAEALARARRE